MVDMKYVEAGTEIGELVESKQVQYGNSAAKSAKILEILYPDGIPVHAYDRALLMVRIFDKMSRISQQGPDRKDLGGESPFMDIAGYALLGWVAAMEGGE